jgi:hypothetical protein
MWTYQQTINFFQEIYPMVNVVIAILWGVYVYFTIQTFKEIHRQTELQCEAFLMVTCETMNSVPDNVINKICKTSTISHDKWTEIVKTHIPAAIGLDSHLILTLTNKGRSDIISWKIKEKLNIQPGQYLKNKFNTFGETISWDIESENKEDLIEPGQSIQIEVSKIGGYPLGEFSWEIEYADMRNKTYKTFSGDKLKIIRNALAFDMKE